MKDVLETIFNYRKQGVDIFYSYSPHTNCASIQVFCKGWDFDKKIDAQATFCDADEPEVAEEILNYIIATAERDPSEEHF